MPGATGVLTKSVTVEKYQSPSVHAHLLVVSRPFSSRNVIALS